MKRRVWGTAAAVVAAVTGVVVFQGVQGDDGGKNGANAPLVTGPVRTSVHTASVKAEGDRAEVPERDTAAFSLVGLSWTKPSAQIPGTVQVRTRSARTGAWGSWITLDTGGHGAAAEESRRGATEPAWVGPSDGVQARVDGRGTPLPAGMRLEMVDPGAGRVAMNADPVAFAADDPTATPGDETSAPADTATEAPTQAPTDEPTPSPSTPSASDPAPTATTTPAPTPTPTASGTATLPPAPVSTAPEPPVVTRAQWGADESLNNEAPEYGTEVKAVFVHHTVDANDYSCADSAAMVRAIRTYHIQSNGWKDIGYNFLVDKCGTIFEGRKGGVDRPVIGAHNPGFNTNTVGISVLGEYTSIDASAAAKASVARVAAWKLGQYHYDPTGKVDLTAGMDNGKFKLGQTASFYRISGHRDGFSTECPGDKLYASLPGIRTLAGGPVSGLALKTFGQASVSGSTAYTKGPLTVNWAITSPTALVSRYEVLVDGKVANTATPTATSASLSLAPGTHTVAVRAVHVSGRTAVTPNATVVADTTAPSFATKPSVALRAGTVNTTAVPVTLGWKAADSAALKEARLTSPSAHTYGPTVYSAALTSNSGTATTWSMTAYDQAGNTARATVAATPVILQETSATRTGTWTTKSSSSYLGGKSYSSSSKNASLTWKFTGRSVAWAVSRASTSGQAYVYVDGTKTATVDLKSSTTKYRDALWTKTWSAGAAHTIKIVVVGTSGRPTVTTDGLVYIK
ncbi:N-acetylmuramoyl-L-alanine amidase [Streptomyces sp. NBC_00820]|uniref:N-acetylmuramoyl-L-alanine amidase n=1 Tax=Streptomyces sp. NBC_00820 TaxID=2975842 RepID=UPI002ED31813|nr:N-acetylmuramoyl-L-alanine amidase [Streptomyces sp. NBC_00820]